MTCRNTQNVTQSISVPPCPVGTQSIQGGFFSGPVLPLEPAEQRKDIDGQLGRFRARRTVAFGLVLVPAEDRRALELHAPPLGHDHIHTAEQRGDRERRPLRRGPGLSEVQRYAAEHRGQGSSPRTQPTKEDRSRSVSSGGPNVAWLQKGSRWHRKR